MKNWKNLSATVLVYTLVLVNLALIMGVVIMNNNSVLDNNEKAYYLNKEISHNIIEKSQLSIKHAKNLNSNGSGFIDEIQCPNLTLSGSSIRETFPTFAKPDTVNKNLFCEGTGSNYGKFILTYDNNISPKQFTQVESVNFWQIQNFPVFSSSNPEQKTFWSFFAADFPRASFLNTDFQNSDGIDDNFDSDNYKPNSTGAIAYPNSQFDDDTNTQKLLFGYVWESVWYKNIFWSNSKIIKYLSGSVHDDSQIGQDLAVLHLKTDLNNKLKVVQFDKSLFDANWELKPISTENITLSNVPESHEGYIQTNGSLSSTKTWNEMVFNFELSDYALFINNTSTGSLRYDLRAENATWDSLSLNPINFDWAKSIEVLWYDVLEKEWRYSSKMFEVSSKK